MLSNILLAGLLANGALAGFTVSKKIDGTSGLRARQADYGSDAYIAAGNIDTDYVAAGTCSQYPGLVQCGASVGGQSLCFNPVAGEDCCSDGSRCPVDAYCLVEGFCCDDEDTPLECANQILAAGYDIIVADATTVSQSTRPTTASSSRIAPPRTSSILNAKGGSSSHASATGSNARPFGTAASARLPTTTAKVNGTVTGLIQATGSVTRPGMAKFTGAANSIKVLAGGAAAGAGAFLIGVFGTVGYLL